MSESYNSEFNPTGIEGGVDTNDLPWMELSQIPGLAVKPLRASLESGMFSLVVKVAAGTRLTNLVHLGAMDMLVLSGSMTYSGVPLSITVEPGIWGYLPANTRIDQIEASEACEFLGNFYGPVLVSGDRPGEVASVLTALDICQLARDAGITLIPNTLAECMQPRPDTPRAEAEPLAIAGSDSAQLVEANATNVVNIESWLPHFVDTRAIEWIENPDLGDIALKILRVSEETGITSLIVRHNGVAGPHYHLGAADFLVLKGHIGYRAGPPEGYGPGVWFFEPAGARHEATQRVSDDEDLIYTANVYGPVQFDEGPGTPIVAVQSWMQYRALAEAYNIKLVTNTFPGDTSLLAWAPIGSNSVTQ